MSPARRSPRDRRPARRAGPPARRLVWIRAALVAGGLACLALGGCTCVTVWTSPDQGALATVGITLIAFAWLILPGLMLVQLGVELDDPDG